jgi:hypothetical protein
MLKNDNEIYLDFEDNMMLRAVILEVSSNVLQRAENALGPRP